MKPHLSIDYQNHGRFARFGWLLLGVAVLLVLDAMYTQRTAESELMALESHLQGKSSVVQSSNRLSSNSTEAAEVQLREAEDVLRQLTIPWHTLFQSIERAFAEEVALLAVQPDVQRRSITIVGEAKQYNDVLAYVTRLRAEAPLASVYLVGNEIKENDPQRPLLFTVSARWRGGQ
ncbi:MAG TPA: PilN domain-containing protein [Blastocatellia bacterium]|nr:PilN domain-containing protein [Blastocatellia bacterium]